MPSGDTMLTIVLIEPEIPQNTGNIARLCAATGAPLILVGKLGFSLSDKYLKRAGMDYWEHVSWRHLDTVEQFFAQHDTAQMAFISTKGAKVYTEISADIAANGYLVFGRESTGLPPFVYEAYRSQLYRIPMREGIRSLNLSSSAALSLYHLLEKGGFQGLG